MKRATTLIIIGAFVFLTTCTKDIAGPGACFQEEVLPIFVSNCSMTGCHNSISKTAGYDLSNYEGIMKGIRSKHPLGSELYNAVRGKNPSMPPSSYPKLSSQDLSTIKLWIDKGANNSHNCRGCDTINFTYNGRIKNTIQVWCVGCHNSGNSGGGFDLSDYNGVVKSIANNKLLGSLKHDSGISAMPKNSAKLSDCEIKAVEKWINNGYLNN